MEILPPATALKDRHTKFEIYQQQRIPCYLIVDGGNKDVEIYTLSEGMSYQKMVLNQQAPFGFSIDDCFFEVTVLISGIDFYIHDLSVRSISYNP